MKKNLLKTIGWREWVALPELGVNKIKVKVDTGARTSSIHAFDMEIYTRAGQDYVKYKLHPNQKDIKKTISCKSKVIEYRSIRSSNGAIEHRPVILTDISVFGLTWPIEITLTNRDEMGFRMLLGRASIKNMFLVNPGKSFLSNEKR